MSKIAFLLLTYDEHNKYKTIKNFLKQGNIYVHAKNPTDIKSYLKNYIIKDYVKTEWGDFSLVKAEVKLLENAIKNEENEWFILLSQSCYPLLTYNQLHNQLNYNGNKYSFFNYITTEENTFFKSSQFWILNREDAKTIINTQEKYFKLYKNKKIMDERYFLTVLMKENKNYIYNNKIVTYSRWIVNIGSYHPIIFNKLTPYDKEMFNNNNSFFFRKVSENFSFTPIKLKDNLLFIYIDTLKDLNVLQKIIDKDSSDYIIFYSAYGYDLIPNKLLNKSIYLISVHYLLFNEYYKLFLEQYKDVLSQWKNINLIVF